MAATSARLGPLTVATARIEQLSSNVSYTHAASFPSWLLEGVHKQSWHSSFICPQSHVLLPSTATFPLISALGNARHHLQIWTIWPHNDHKYETHLIFMVHQIYLLKQGNTCLNPDHRANRWGSRLRPSCMLVTGCSFTD